MKENKKNNIKVKRENLKSEYGRVGKEILKIIYSKNKDRK